jgi:hypothetical protein
MTTADLTPAQWARHSNVQLAKKLGITPQAVQQARARHKAPPSPAPRGGDTTLQNGKPTDTTSAVINCTKAQKRAWMRAKGPQKLDAWATAALDLAAQPKP